MYLSCQNVCQLLIVRRRCDLTVDWLIDAWRKAANIQNENQLSNNEPFMGWTVGQAVGFRIEDAGLGLFGERLEI